MKLTFTEEDPDDTLEELASILGFVEVEVAQYFVESDEPLEYFDFGNPLEYRKFFAEFAEYANPLWSSKTGVHWDFGKTPFRVSSPTMSGVYRILRTGGAYSGGREDAENFEKAEAIEIEGRLREEFLKNASRLVIICIVKFDYTNDGSGGVLVDMDSYGELGEISPFFNRVAWDDLIFIINPEYSTLYVIAFTDTD